MKLRNVFSSKQFVFGIAVILHVSIVFALGHYHDPTLWENGIIAESLLHGKGFSKPLFHEPHRKDNGVFVEKLVNGKGSLPASMNLYPTSNQAPGYPVLLFLTWKLLGEKPSAYLMISLIQAILVSSIVFPIAWLTRKWFGQKPVVWVCWISCLMPTYAWYVTRLHQPAIMITFYPWLLAGWLGLVEANSWWRTVLLGLATGLAGLFNPVLLGVFSLIGAILLFKSLQQRKVANARMLLVAAALVLLVLTPWTVRNYKVHGQLILIKNCFGKELWIGNNPKSSIVDCFIIGPENIPSEWMELNEMQLMKVMKHEAIDYIRSDPLPFAERTLKRIFWFWTTPAKGYLFNSEQSGRLRWDWLRNSYWFGFLLLASIVRIFDRKFPREYVMVLAVFFMIYSFTYGLTHVGLTRFRSEIEFIIFPAATQGLVIVLKIRKQFSSR
ncbi:hypothetical protein ACFLZE_05405 [Thermodesulfobacteriota bacterium]